MTMWGGRFDAGGTHPLLREINDSLRFDCALLEQDIAASQAWAHALGQAGVLTGKEAQRLIDALDNLAAETAGRPELVAESDAEDVHTWVENALTQTVGDVAKKLHTGRSRNDQVATDLRLWVREAIGDRVAEIRAAQASLLRLAEREIDTVLPGYTHLQRAQPVLFAHWCLAYFEMLQRDAGRFLDAARRANECPLGSGALAGTAYPIDRAALAADLGFDAPTRNSLDAVSDRDFVVEALGAGALCQTHLSRLAEDMILYASAEFGFVELSDAAATGSSLMPQKKNPDGFELLRGKAGRALGALVALLTTLKGRPLAYNKDLQEDKEPLFDAMRSLSLCLRALPMMLDGLTVRRDRCLAAAAGGHANATDLADYLVGRGVAFREAHAIAGRLVRKAIEKGVAIEALPLAELRAESPLIQDDVYAAIALTAGLAKRDVFGGTAPQRVHAALREAKERLASASHPKEPAPCLSA